MNILLKAFDGAKYQPLLKAAFRGHDIGTCISITNVEITPDIHTKRFIWMPAKPLRDAAYPDTDWNTIAPLDAEIIEKMRHAEAMFLPMVDRYARRGDISYGERKRQYLAHLRFWSSVLDHEKIGLFLINHIPHQCFDYVIYELCKLKGIPTYHLERCYSVDGVFLVKDFEKSAEQLIPAMERLRKEYADPSKPVPLSPSYETFYAAEIAKAEYPWFTGARAKHLTRRSFIAKWIGKSWELLHQKPRKFFAAITAPDVWTRKCTQHRTMQFYDARIREPDFSAPYVYAPLHMQPEETTSPRGGAFVNQELIIQMLAAHLPHGIGVYVKEHPAQGELCRSEEFYRSMCAYPSVTFVPRNCDTFKLTEHAQAVATVTGTAGLEALFLRKPVFMFGHRFYQYAPGVYPIRSSEDCKRAVQEIFEEKCRPTLRDMRMFLKAVEECSVLLLGGPPQPNEALLKKSMQSVGGMIRTTLQPLFV